MLLTVLSVPDCPHTSVLLDRIRTALGAQSADLEVVLIGEDDRARQWGMTGSPTLLVNGVDPFTAGLEPSVSCRLSHSADGSRSGVPSLADLKAVFGPGRRAALVARPVDVAGRGGRGRRAPVEGGLRAVQRSVLRAIVDTGLPPGAAELDRVAEAHGRGGTEVLHELAAEDFLTLDQSGQLRAVYPFSVSRTRHHVRIEDGPQVWAMCAIDALGIARMIERSVTIDSADPITADPITVHVTTAGVRANPAGVVVFVGRRGCDGPAEQTCCDLINFFGSRHSATRWASRNADTDGEILDLNAAAELGRLIFGGLLIGV